MAEQPFRVKDATASEDIVAQTLTVSGAITANGTGNSIAVADTLRIAQTGSGLRMTNVGAFDNDGSNNFRIFGTNDLILAANGETGTAITIDAAAQDVTVQNDLRIGTSALYINGTQVTTTAAELNQLDGVTLGTAASANTGDFATAAQGALADTALQTVAVDGVTITGDGTVGNPLVASGGGGGGVSIGDAVGGGTAGSILFVDASGNLAQDNTQLFWDNTNNRLGIGTATPTEALDVRGNVLIQDPSSTGSSDHLVEVVSPSSSTADNAIILVSGDTDSKVPRFNIRDVEANGGVFNNQYSAYFALDRATPIVTGSAQNDLLIANGNFNKDIHLCTNNAGDGSQAQARLTIVGSDGDVGIGTTSPSQKLHVVGTIRQTNSTSAVLVSDGNGDIGSAANLQDVAYSDGLYVDGSGMYPLVPPAPSAWGGPPPANFNEAIDRLAAAVYNFAGPIP